MKSSRLGSGPEFDLIRELLREGSLPAHAEGVRVPPGDDCAMVQGEGIVLSSDLSVEDVHFRRDWLTPEEIGYRAVAGALSDLAAVAARPIGVLVSMALPAQEAAALVPAIRSGIVEACEVVGASLLGGDLARSPRGLLLDVTAVGEAARPVLRSGARPGDGLWVTGVLGGSGAAVRAWEAGDTPAPEARRAFARPVPRIHEALWLARHGTIHALIDLSDGLAGDAGHLAAASGVEIVIDREAVPVHPAATAFAAAASGQSTAAGSDRTPGDPSASPPAAPSATGPSAAVPADPDRGPGRGDVALELALRGGEDYELCFTAPVGTVEPLREAFQARFGIPLTRTGTVGGGRAGVRITSGEGTSAALSPGGYDHFKKGDHSA